MTLQLRKLLLTQAHYRRTASAAHKTRPSLGVVHTTIFTGDNHARVNAFLAIA